MHISKLLNQKPGRDEFERGRTHERRRLASELHDGVLQSLANVARTLDGTRKWMRQAEKRPPEDLERSADEIRASIREMREVLTGNHEFHAWHAGTLRQRIEAETRELSRDTGLRIQLKTKPRHLPHYSAHLEREVFLATREALRNVARHSGATNAHLGLSSTRDALTVTLIDDGAGFRRTRGAHAEGTGHRTPHYGLKSIASRVTALDGHITISSSAERGTVLSFRIPADRAPESSREEPSMTQRARAFALGGTLIAGVLATAILLPRAGGKEPALRPPRGPDPAISPAVAHSIAVENLAAANPLEISVSNYQRAADAIVTGWRPSLSPFERLDLSDRGYEMIARKTRQEQGLRSRAFVYQHQKTKELLIAEEFADAHLSNSPAGKIKSFDHEYATFSDDGVYSVAWEQDDVLCVLTSTLPERDLLELAHEVTLEHVAGHFPGN